MWRPAVSSRLRYPNPCTCSGLKIGSGGPTMVELDSTRLVGRFDLTTILELVSVLFFHFVSNIFLNSYMFVLFWCWVPYSHRIIWDYLTTTLAALESLCICNPAPNIVTNMKTFFVLYYTYSSEVVMCFRFRI